jgi:hypothetical protein
VTSLDSGELAEALRLARRELKLARGEQEVAVETLQKVRRQRAALRGQVDAYSEALAGLLSEQYWREQRGVLRGAVRRVHRTPEQEMVAEVEAAPEFDAAWYLRHNPDVVAEQVSPAVHYVRIGGRKGREPGPTFDTAGYLRDHPEARDSDLSPLLHHLRSRSGG